MMAAAAHTATPPEGHVPVMLAEVVEAMAPRADAVYVDATFGAGGYTQALLEAADCQVWALDRDPSAVSRGALMAGRYPGRLHVIEGRFGSLDEILRARGVPEVDGVVFDLGLSTPQLETAERGFSFSQDGPLDMRMGGDGPTAAAVVNNLSREELARIIRDYGEEKKARRVAQAIVEARATHPISRTGELAEIVRAAAGKTKGQHIDPATRTFQALRIYVNDELGELARGLRASERVLAPGGRLVVVSFHSLEDRMVKQFLRMRSGELSRPSRHSPDVQPGQTPPAASFRLLGRGARKPGTAEVEENPRARSARLRTAERSDAPAWVATTGGLA